MLSEPFWWIIYHWECQNHQHLHHDHGKTSIFLWMRYLTIMILFSNCDKVWRTVPPSEHLRKPRRIIFTSIQAKHERKQYFNFSFLIWRMICSFYFGDNNAIMALIVAFDNQKLMSSHWWLIVDNWPLSIDK